MEREAAKKQEEIFAMEKLNDALNEKLKSLSMEVCLPANPIEILFERCLKEFWTQTNKDLDLI